MMLSLNPRLGNSASKKYLSDDGRVSNPSVAVLKLEKFRKVSKRRLIDIALFAVRSTANFATRFVKPALSFPRHI